MFLLFSQNWVRNSCYIVVCSVVVVVVDDDEDVVVFVVLASPGDDVQRKLKMKMTPLLL